jgi:hypothetical protein
VSEKPKPAANEEKATEESKGKPEASSEEEDDEGKRRSRLAMTLQEAEIIAQNLKESGTRR